MATTHRPPAGQTETTAAALVQAGFFSGIFIVLPPFRRQAERWKLIKEKVSQDNNKSN